MSPIELAQRRYASDEAKRGSELGVKNDVVAAYYEALQLVGIAMDEAQKTAAERLVPPGKVMVVNGGDGLQYKGFEGPDVRELMAMLRAKRKVRRVSPKNRADDREDIERILTIFENNTTTPDGPTFWDLGNRSQDERYKNLRIAQEAIDLAGGKYGAGKYLKKGAAEMTLGMRRELILSDDPDRFYAVQMYRNGQLVRNQPGVDVEIYGERTPETISDKSIEQAKAGVFDQDDIDYQSGQSDDQEPEVLHATFIHRDRSVRVRRTWRPNKRTAVFAGALTAITATGLETTGTTTAWEAIRNRSASHRIVEPVLDMELGAPITLPAPTPDSTTTTLTQPTTTMPPTTLALVEVQRPIDPIGVAWLSDTMNPWKEMIAKEAAKYGLDPALPAIYIQLKSAGNYRLNNDGLKGLFPLSDAVVKDAIAAEIVKAPAPGLPVEVLNADVSVAAGTWNLDRKYVKAKGSIRQTMIELGETEAFADLMQKLWDERKQSASAVFEKEKEGYLGVMVKKARKILAEDGLL